MAVTWRGRWERVVASATANPVGFFLPFRGLTWAMALLVVLTRSAPEVNLRYEPGLLMYTALQLALGTLYVLLLHPRLARYAGGPTLLRTPSDLVAVGLADILGSLTVVFFSGGWGSPFWHYAVTSLLVPCFLLRPVWGMATAAGLAAWRLQDRWPCRQRS
ncbi:MAG: hypothetical protein HY683_08835 [Chloroflexi bacterium]|nr:hypothetical protein [Chloroflexota bacterium]